MLTVYPAHQQTVIVGNAALNCGASEILEVIKSPTDGINDRLEVIKSPTNGINDRRIILMRTTLNTTPFMDLSTGELWGHDLSGYVFVHVNANKMTLE